MPPPPSRLERAFELFDTANGEDPHVVDLDGERIPRELLYARRMTRWLEKFEPDASEALQLAARCQHIQRWEIPRGNYPRDRVGYLRWRTDLAKFHADTAGAVLASLDYDEGTIARVRSLLRKEMLTTDPEAQILEDVICLVFIEHELADFASRHPEEKLLGIIRKTWKKMSRRGQETALALPLQNDIRALIEKALEV